MGKNNKRNRNDSMTSDSLPLPKEASNENEILLSESEAFDIMLM